jgi:hypothetical protein
MKFDKKFIARSRMRFLLGSGIAGIIMSFVTLLTFAKVWATTFEYYGIPMLPVYIAFPVLYMIVCWYGGLLYERSGVWGEETSFVNKTLNPEFLELYNDVKEIKKSLNIPEKNQKE